jgi:hypothetical protein
MDNKVLYGAWNPVNHVGDSEPHASVYRNLNQNCWSVKIDGLVAIHAETLVIRNPYFFVSQKGRARVLRQRRKNVHAYVRGKLHWAVTKDIRYPVMGINTHPYPGPMSNAELLDGIEVTYNPYHSGRFVYKNGNGNVEPEHDDYILLDWSRRMFIGKQLVVGRNQGNTFQLVS